MVVDVLVLACGLSEKINGFGYFFGLIRLRFSAVVDEFRAIIGQGLSILFVPTRTGVRHDWQNSDFYSASHISCCIFRCPSAYNKHGEKIGNLVEAHEANHRNLKAKKKSKTTTKSNYSIPYYRILKAFLMTEITTNVHNKQTMHFPAEIAVCCAHTYHTK